MHITVKCFAGCKEAVGWSERKLELRDAATVEAALDELVKQYPRLDHFRSSLMLAVNTDYANRDVILKDGDVLACIPPVSGGLGTKHLYYTPRRYV